MTSAHRDILGDWTGVYRCKCGASGASPGFSSKHEALAWARSMLCC
jgi:hypothetical protein